MKKATYFSTLWLVGGLLLTPTVYAGKGMLKIVTDPGEAKIYINGKRKGSTPAEKGQIFAVKLAEGEYSCRPSVIFCERGKLECEGLPTTWGQFPSFVKRG